jgi:hypothetical protein
MKTQESKTESAISFREDIVNAVMGAPSICCRKSREKDIKNGTAKFGAMQ